MRDVQTRMQELKTALYAKVRRDAAAIWGLLLACQKYQWSAPPATAAPSSCYVQFGDQINLEE
jgi:hypothetical protein